MSRWSGREGASPQLHAKALLKRLMIRTGNQTGLRKAVDEEDNNRTTIRPTTRTGDDSYDGYALCWFRRCAQLEGLMKFMDRARARQHAGGSPFWQDLVLPSLRCQKVEQLKLRKQLIKAGAPPSVVLDRGGREWRHNLHRGRL